jgi:hypothetical protein
VGGQLAADADQLVVVPDEEPALDALGVGVLGGEEAAVGVAQLAQQVVRGAGGDLPVAGAAGELPGVQVDGHQLRVVVQHLLEVGHQPAPVGGVAVEAAAELVEDAAGGHPVQRERGHVERAVEAAEVAAEQQL